MDLSMKDVADLLQVKPSTVERWMQQKTIPYYRLAGKPRFAKIEIEEWILSQHEELKEKIEAKGISHFNLFRAMHKGGVLRDIEGDDKEQIISQVMHRMASQLEIDADVFTELLLDRERLMPTAIGSGIAVPHTRDFLIPKSYDMIVTVFLKKPIEYGALDGKEVHTLFFLFACEDKRHLHLLAKIAHLSMHQEGLDLLQSRPDQEKLLDFVKEFEMRSQKEEIRT